MSMVGFLARSKAGHDKNKVYIIIEETEEYVFLSDGLYKPFQAPKKKKKKHIQVIKKEASPQLIQRLLKKEAVNDEEIKRTIKLYEQSMNRQI